MLSAIVKKKVRMQHFLYLMLNRYK